MIIVVKNYDFMFQPFECMHLIGFPVTTPLVPHSVLMQPLSLLRTSGEREAKLSYLLLWRAQMQGRHLEVSTKFS